MSKTFLGLVTTDEIRGALGVDSTDVDDDLIDSYSPEKDLKASLMSWVPTYPTIISEGAAGSPDDAQTLKYLTLQNYAKYFTSAISATSAVASILQKKSDGSNEGVRFSNVSFRDLKLDLEARAAAARSELEALVAPTQVATYSQFSKVIPTYDPVTNTEP